MKPLVFTFRNCEVSYNGQRFEASFPNGSDYFREEPGLLIGAAFARAKQIAADPAVWCELEAD